MGRPCRCDRCLPGGPYRAGDCRLCWLAHNHPGYRASWGDAAAAAPAPPRRSLPCVHLGAVLNSLGCGCSRKWVRECWKHDTCTLDDPSHGRCCSSCPDYEAQGVAP